MIQLEQINKSYPMGQSSLHVLHDIDLHISSGELVSIMGSSGSGKSTLLNIIGLLDRHDTGSYTLSNESMDGLSENAAARYRGQYIGFIFQSFNLIAFKTALENVALPLYYQGVPRRERQETARRFLARVGLEPWAEHLPTELSGGEQQRVAVARALVTQPRLILADEPTGALDTENSYELMDLFREVNAEGVTVVVVTHETDIADRTNRVIRLRDGQVESS